MSSPILVPASEFSVVCEQVFSRKSLSFLWEKRNLLDAGQLSIVNSLYNNRKKGSVDGSVRVEYKLARGIPGKLGFGRLYGTKGSMETLERECRGTLCEEFYYDIDVRNAHPVFLYQFAKLHYGRDMPEVKKYCDNRDACLKQISSNRDEAKTAFLKVMYGGKCEYDFLQGYEREVSSFARLLGNQEKYQELMTYLRKQDKNVYASLLSLILQTEERSVMLSMKKSLEKLGWSVDVLAYDGVMVRKNKNMELTDDMLRQVEKDILADTHYGVDLVDKQFEKYDVPVEAGDIAPKITKQLYESRRDEFETNHFYYAPTNTIAEINTDGSLSFYTLDHAKVMFKPFDFKHSAHNIQDRTSFITLWLDDNEKRVHYEIDMKPSENPRVYSPPLVFKYLQGTSSDNDDIHECFGKLINLASSGNLEMQMYLVKWFAHILQKPFENPGTSIILTGDQGCGKDTLGDFISEFVIGRQYSHNYTSTDQFWDKHDCERMGKLFVKIEEASGFVNRQHIGQMKALVTSHNITVNPKGQRAITSGNYNRFFMTTNEGTPVKMEEGNRRFIITPCSSEKIGDFAFWTKVRKTLFNEEGGATIGKWLSEIDLTDFDPKMIPVTAYANTIAETEMSPEDRFIQQWDGKPVLATEFYGLYRTYCFENDLRAVPTCLSFGHKLLVPLRRGTIIKTHTCEGAMYSKTP